MKGLVTLLVLIAVGAGLFALGSLRRESDNKPLLHVAEEVPLTVKVAMPERGGITRLVQAPGDVEAVLEVDISSEVVAKIEEMPVEEGDIVEQGDLLCRLDDKNLLAELESANERIAQLQAAILQAEADLEKADRDCERQMRLSESDATSRIEVLDYLTVRKKARAVLTMRGHELAQAEAMRKRLDEDLKRTIIMSPIDGVVAKINAKQGEVVVTGTMNNPGTVIMTVTDLSSMQVRARVDEVEIPLVKSEQRARVYLQSDPDKPVPARVVRVASKGVKPLGRDVVTFEAILAVLSNDERIKPGMTANVEIEVARSENAITVPVEAVVHRMRKELDEKIVAQFDERQENLDLSERARQAQYIKVVYVKKDNTAKVRLIDPGIADSRRVELCDGVTIDDAVIIGPYRSLDQLKDGRKVALAEADSKKEGTGEPGADERPDEETEQRNAEGDESSSDDSEEKQSVAVSRTP
jgi:HlyD family secretion protein